MATASTPHNLVAYASQCLRYRRKISDSTFSVLPAGRIATERGSNKKQRSLDLRDLVALGQRKFLYTVHETVNHRFLWRDVDVLEAPRDENFLRDSGALAQDVFRAGVVGERCIE